MIKEIYICDRCGIEMKDGDFYNLNLERSDGIGIESYQICPDCMDEFKIFMKRSKSVEHNNHGIERMTIGAK